MQTQTLSDSDGTFNGWAAIAKGCPKCEGLVLFRRWESSCGGYADHQYRCEDCSYSWWVDGPDA